MEMNGARRVLRCRTSERCACVEHIPIHVDQIGMIEGVEHLDTKFYVDLFTLERWSIDQFFEIKIDTLVAGLIVSVPPQITFLTERGAREGRGREQSFQKFLSRLPAQMPSK